MCYKIIINGSILNMTFEQGLNIINKNNKCNVHITNRNGNTMLHLFADYYYEYSIETFVKPAKID